MGRVMKLKNKIFSEETVSAVNELMKQPLSAVEAFKLAKLSRQLIEKQGIYLEARLGVFKKFGVLKDKQYVLKPEKMEEAQKELADLVQMENEYDFEKIKIGNDIKLSGSQVMLLEDIIEI